MTAVGGHFAAARLGVDLFFVLSGFLITLLLFREQDRDGRISLRAFYTRRSLRILPAYYTYLAFVSLLWATGQIKLSASDWVGPLTFLTNLTSPSRILGHTWSLSVEEQFYLCWPLILFTFGRRQAVFVLIGVSCFAPIARFIVVRRWPGDYASFITPCVADSIAFGCLLAYVVVSCPRVVAWVERRAGAVLILSALLIGFAFVQTGPIRVPSFLTSSVWRIALASGILATIGLRHSPLGRLLGSQPVAWVGVLSYSLYLWHQPFLVAHSTEWYCQRPVNILLTVAAAIASHYLIERPFLRIKDRLLSCDRTVPATPHFGPTAGLVSHS